MKLRVQVAVYLYNVFYQWNNRMVVVPNVLGLISVGYFTPVELGPYFLSNRQTSLTLTTVRLTVV